ncbi:MAG: AMP-binding protein [Actinomycetota bacterium]
MSLTSSYVVGPSTPEVRDVTIGSLLHEAAEAAPDRLALVLAAPEEAARRHWTYAEVDREADRVARAVAARFDKGQRVAVWAHNVGEWVLLQFGCARAGVVLVTINPAFRAREAKYVLQQSRVAAVFAEPEYREHALVATAQELQPECPDLGEVISFADWEAFVATGDDPSIELPDVGPADPALMLYTSGTTGFPKGAVLRHGEVSNNSVHCAGRLGFRDDTVFLSPMPLFHAGGCVVSLLSSVAAKSTFVLPEAFDPTLMLRLCETYGATVIHGVPTMLISMLEDTELHEHDRSSVERVFTGGALVPQALVERIEREFGASFSILYGQTESGPVVTTTLPTDSAVDKASTIGVAMPNLEVKIVSPETGETVPVGAVGELCTRGYNVMDGYFEMPERTAEAIDEDGWLHTGDLCSMDDRGYCTIVGRVKDMIIRGGENIYPKELEDLLFSHHTVGEVAVVGLPDERWGEVVAAFVRAAPDETIVVEELRTFMREHLAAYKTPAHWFAMEEFPLTGSGKIQKFRLVEMWEGGDFEEL